MAQEVVITYETLFEVLQREKERADLQKLEPTFFSDTINYIKDKKKIIEAKSDSTFALDEKKKTERQLENIYKILKEIYERRERKIINMALDKSRTKSNLIDTTALLKEERVVFDALTNLLDTYRDAILYSVLNEKMPFMQPNASDLNASMRAFSHAGQSELAHKSLEDKKPKEDFKTALELKKSTKLVRFIYSVARFVGPELEEYGPFEEEDIANLPAEIADVLISKEKAEEIKEE
ncbi:DNA replication complex GINS family protein [Candidatus Woesearchaeota archaeon]|nr:DNA replication complex GINS family protein [Candidatus Woesearchaeota archaeon]